jgi:peptidyl-prolyl cis-trans isomerase SurA
MKRILLCLISALLCSTALPSRGEVVDRIVAVVNDDVVTLREVEKYVAVEKKSRYSSMNEYTRNLELREKLDMFIETLLINQQAKKFKVEVADKEVEEAIANIRKQNIISDSELRSQLKRENIDYKEFTEGIKRTILRNKVQARAVAQDVATDDKSLRAYYDTHTKDYTPEEYRMQHIFVSAQTKDADAVAEAALAQLDRGRPFGDVVQEFSDESAKAQNGDMGFVKPEDLFPELREAIKLLIPGTYTRVVRTPYGYHILRLMEVRKGQAPPFEQVKGQIKERLFRLESEKRWKEFMAKLRSSSYVEVKI